MCSWNKMKLRKESHQNETKSTKKDRSERNTNCVIRIQIHMWNRNKSPIWTISFFVFSRISLLTPNTNLDLILIDKYSSIKNQNEKPPNRIEIKPCYYHMRYRRCYKMMYFRLESELFLKIEIFFLIKFLFSSKFCVFPLIKLEERNWEFS